MKPLLASFILVVVALQNHCFGEQAVKVNYQDHALPIFRNSCLGCHNPDKKKGGLDLTTWRSAMAGGSDGVVINPGDPAGSLLYRVLTHEDEPNMPPKQDKLPQAQLDLIRQWIAAGALPTADGKPAPPKSPVIDLSFKAPIGHRAPQGPPPMPNNLMLESLIHARRSGALSALAASPWAPVVALAGQHQVLLYNPQSLSLLGLVPFADGQPQTLNFSSNGKLLLIGGGEAARSGKVALWDITNGTHVTDVGGEYDAVLAADLSPDQTRVALGGPGKLLKVYATKDGSLIDAIKVHTDWVTAVAYSPDGILLASGDRAGGLWVWEARTDRQFYNLAGHKAGITAIAFRPDSNVLASASEDGTIKLWDLRTGKQARSWQAHAGGVLWVNIASDGRIVSCGRDHAVRLWKADGSALRQLGTFSDIVLRAVFDSDGKHVVAGDFTGDVRVFDVAQASMVGRLDLNPPPLADRISDAQQRVMTARALVDSASSNLEATKSARDSASKNLENRQADLGNLKKSITDLKSQVAQAQSAEKSARDQLTDERQQVAEKARDQNRQQMVVANARSILQSAQQALNSANQRLAAQQQLLNSAERAMTKAQFALEQSPDDPDVEDAADEAQKKFDQTSDDVARLQTSDTDAQHRLDSARDSFQKAKTQLDGINDQLDPLRQALSADEKSHASLMQKIQQMQKQLATDRANLPAEEKGIADAQNEVAVADRHFEDDTSRLHAASSQLATAQLDLARLKAGQLFTAVLAARKTLIDARSAEQDARGALTTSDKAGMAGRQKALDEAIHAAEIAKSKDDQLESDYRKLTEQIAVPSSPPVSQ